MFNATTPWNIDYKEILLDEIALDGLSGIPLEGLWNHVSHRTSWVLNDKVKEHYLRAILSFKDEVAFYEHKDPVVVVPIVDRFSRLDDTWTVVEPDEPLDGPYEFAPVPNELGSCAEYKQRKVVPHDLIASLSLSEVNERWGNRLVVVASEDARWRAIAPRLPKSQWDRAKIHNYCLLELIGKARYNGITSTGVTNVQKILKCPKHLFYVKKILASLKLITSMRLRYKTDTKHAGCLVMRLVRFSKPKLATRPKTGVLSAIIDRLKALPDRSERCVDVYRSLDMSARNFGRLMKTMEVGQFLKITNATRDNPDSKQKTDITKGIVTLQEPTSDAEEEEEAPSSGVVRNQCRYGVPVVRQAYRLIEESGATGLSLIEIGRILNLDYVNVRGVVRTLTAQNSIKRILTEHGRMRIGKFITTKMQQSTCKFEKFTEEYMSYVDRAKELSRCADNSSVDVEEETSELWRLSDHVTEIKSIPGIDAQVPYSSSLFKKAGHTPPYGHMMKVMALLKLMYEKRIVCGIYELTTLVQKSVNMEQIDGKTFKKMLQRIMNDNLIRYFKVAWPASTTNTTVFICTPDITTSHPLVKAHFRDLCFRYYRTTNTQKTMKSATDNSSYVEFYYPKYMRAMELHKFLYNVIYVQNIWWNNDLPNGCFRLVDVLREIPVKLALGHMWCKWTKMTEIANNKDIQDVSIKNIDEESRRVLLGSTALILAVKRNLRTLVSFGLCQMCSECCQLADGALNTNDTIYYLNLNGRIVDTSGEWPNDEPLKVQKFKFESTEHVEYYWNTLRIVGRNTVVERGIMKKRVTAPPAPNCVPTEAAAKDTGEYVPGDGKGGAGFDSIYHIYAENYWTTNHGQAADIAGVKRKHAVPMEAHKLNLKLCPRKKRKKCRTDTSKPVKVKKTRIRAVKKPEDKPATVEKVKPRRLKLYAKWTNIEDKVIVWSRIAKAILCPQNVAGGLQATNYVARLIISRITTPSPDVEPKTSILINARANVLAREQAVKNVKERLIRDLKSNNDIMNNYYGLIKILRVKNITQRAKYFQEAILRMAELIWLISNMPTVKMFAETTPCIARDYEDLQNRFTIKELTEDRFSKKIETQDDIITDTLVEAILQTCNSIMGKIPDSDYSVLVYSIFSSYPENQLRLALDEIRRHGMMTQPKKNPNKNDPDNDAKTLPNFKLTVAYTRSWISAYSYEFAGEIVNNLRTLTPTDDIQCTRANTCIFLELSTAGYVTTQITKNVAVKTLGGLNEPDLELSELDDQVSVKMVRGKVGWSYTDSSLHRLVDLFDEIAVTNEVYCLCRKSLCNLPENYDTSGYPSEIIDYLESKKELGGTLQELESITPLARDVIQDSLRKLEAARLAKRVGAHDNRVVLARHARPWALAAAARLLLPTPWLAMDLRLNTRTLRGWCAAIVEKIADNPGITIKKISIMLKFLAPKHVEDICMFLSALHLVQLKSLVPPVEINLYSCDDQPEMGDDTEYVHPDFIVVMPCVDLLVRYALVDDKLKEFDNVHVVI